MGLYCKRIVNARNFSWLALVGNQTSFIFAFCEFAFPSDYFCICDWTDFFKNTRYTLIGKTYEGWSNIYIRPHFVVCLCRQKANTQCIIYSSYYKTARKLLTNYHYLKSLYFSSHLILLYLLNSQNKHRMKPPHPWHFLFLNWLSWVHQERKRE